MLQDFVSSTIGITILTALILVALLAGTGFLKSRQRELFSRRTTTLALVFSAMAISLGTALSYITIITMPQGGSVTPLSMLIVSLIGFFYGPVQGIICGISYGFLQLIAKPYVIHPVQLILDYPLAFGMLGLSGFFYKKKHGLILGYLVGVTGRFLCSVLSGVVFFGEFAAGTGMTPVLYSIVYNASYMYTEAGLTCILLCLEPVKNGISSVRQIALKKTF